MISSITNKNNKNEASVLPHPLFLAAKSTGNAAKERYENRKSNGETVKERYRLVTEAIVYIMQLKRTLNESFDFSVLLSLYCCLIIIILLSFNMYSILKYNK